MTVALLSLPSLFPSPLPLSLSLSLYPSPSSLPPSLSLPLSFPPIQMASVCVHTCVCRS